MKRIVLLSGGLDSSTLLYKLLNDGRGEILALFFEIGQKSTKKEREAARNMAQSVRVKLCDVCVSDVFGHSRSALLVHNAAKITTVERHGSAVQYCSQGTGIEFRNGVMLAAAVSLAGQIYAGEDVEISFGAIRTRECFPDCTEGFAVAFDRLARLYSGEKIRVTAPMASMGKDEVMALAKTLEVPIEKTWSCYTGNEEPCGICPACLDRRILEGRE